MENDKKKRKRLPKGKRKHIRLIKQEARKAGLSEAEVKKKTQQA
jgi:hypothetical protein